MLFNKVAIVGTGLIGGSLGLAIKKRNLAQTIVGIARHKKTLDIAQRIKAVDETGRSLDLIKDADLIILATPVSHIIEKLPRVFKLAKDEAIIIDVASTKYEVLKIAARFTNNKDFLGCHPLAGSEKRGIDNAGADLFKGTICILTPLNTTRSQTLKKVDSLWHKLGAKTTILSPQLHDRILSFTSHLPHALAFSLIKTIPSDYLKFSASGLKDTTRIASSDPKLWEDIFITNRNELLNSLNEFQRLLSGLKKIIFKKDKMSLLRFLKSAKNKRDSL